MKTAASLLAKKSVGPRDTRRQTMAPTTPRWTDHIQPLTGYHKKTEVVEALEQLARALGPGARLPRMRELADALGITLATLDQGLTHLERRGVFDRRPRSGVFVSSRIGQKTIGMVIGWNIFSVGDDSAFYSLLVEACIQLAEKRGWRCSVFLDYFRPGLSERQLSPAHHDLVNALEDGRLNGLLLVSSQGPHQEEWLRNKGVPLLGLAPGPDQGVIIDTDALVRMAVKELLRQGVRKIGFIGVCSEHVTAFRHALDELGLSMEKAWVSEFGLLPFGTRFELQGGACARELLERAEQFPEKGMPEAIVVTDDLLARGACAEFAKKGFQIGRDLKVVSHANKGSPILDPWKDRVIRCEFDPQEIAAALISRIECLMEGVEPPQCAVILPRLMKAGIK